LRPTGPVGRPALPPPAFLFLWTRPPSPQPTVTDRNGKVVPQPANRGSDELKADRKFIKEVAADNMMQIRLGPNPMVPYFQKEGRSARSSQVRDLVDDELPTLRQDLAMTRRIG
jgi:hypothetical protein